MKKLFLFILLLQFWPLHAQIFDSVYRQAKLATDPVEQFYLWADLSNYYFTRGETDSQQLCNARFMKVAMANDNDTMKAEAYAFTSQYFIQTGDYNLALEYLFKGLNIAREIKFRDDICFCSKQIGVAYKQLKNYPLALKYLKDAVDNLPDSVNDLNRGDFSKIHCHISEAYLALGQVDSALKYVQVATHYTSMSDSYNYARVCYIFASVYLKQGDIDLAESYYKKCISFSDSLQIALPYETATLDYGLYLLNKKQYTLARDLTLRSYQSAVDSKNKPGVINATSQLINIYRLMGLKDSAYYYSYIKDAFRDSVFNEETHIKIQNLSFNQQVKEQEDLARAIEEQEAREHNLQYFGIFIGIVCFVIFLLLLTHSSIASARVLSFLGIVALLLVFEFINLFIHPYITHMTNHSPVFMLLILAAIAALLVPLHHKIEKIIVNKMIERNKRVKLKIARKIIRESGEDEKEDHP